MVFHLFLSLIEPPRLPIQLTHSIDEARSTCKQYLPTTKQPLGSKPSLLKILPYLYWCVIKTHRYKSITLVTLCVLASRCGIKLQHIILSLISLNVLVYIRQVYRIRKWSNNYTGNQYKPYPNLKDESYYHDTTLIESSYKLGVAKYYAVQKIIFQPISGYCGYATLNTVFASIAVQQNKFPLDNGILHYYQTNYISDHAMMLLLDQLKSKHILSEQLGIARYENLCGADYNIFLSHIHQLNNPQYRYIMYWHRSPLFFCDSTIDKRYQYQTTVHWSPIVSYDKSNNLVMVLDVNEDYSEFLVTPERLYDAVNINDFVRGGKMGLIRLILND